MQSNTTYLSPVGRDPTLLRCGFRKMFEKYLFELVPFPVAPAQPRQRIKNVKRPSSIFFNLANVEFKPVSYVLPCRNSAGFSMMPSLQCSLPMKPE